MEIIVVCIRRVHGIVDRNNLEVNRCCWFSLRLSFSHRERVRLQAGKQEMLRYFVEQLES